MLYYLAWLWRQTRKHTHREWKMNAISLRLLSNCWRAHSILGAFTSVRRIHCLHLGVVAAASKPNAVQYTVSTTQMQYGQITMKSRKAAEKCEIQSNDIDCLVLFFVPSPGATVKFPFSLNKDHSHRPTALRDYYCSCCCFWYCKAKLLECE